MRACVPASDRALDTPLCRGDVGETSRVPISFPEAKVSQNVNRLREMLAEIEEDLRVTSGEVDRVQRRFAKLRAAHAAILALVEEEQLEVATPALMSSAQSDVPATHLSAPSIPPSQLLPAVLHVLRRERRVMTVDEIKASLGDMGIRVGEGRMLTDLLYRQGKLAEQIVRVSNGSYRLSHGLDRASRRSIYDVSVDGAVERLTLKSDAEIESLILEGVRQAGAVKRDGISQLLRVNLADRRGVDTIERMIGHMLSKEVLVEHPDGTVRLHELLL